MDYSKFVQKMQQATTSIRELGTIFSRLSTSIPKKADKPGTKKQTKKTQKGATHKVNPVFRGRTVFRIPRKIIGDRKFSPALYRYFHMGIVTRTPNYKLPHPAPQGRNTVGGLNDYRQAR